MPADESSQLLPDGLHPDADPAGQVVCTRRQWLTLAGACLGFGCESSAAPAYAAPEPEATDPPQQRDTTGNAPDAATAANAPAAALGIALQPLGAEIPDAQVQLVRSALRSFYACEIELLPRFGLPKHTFYAPRQRYRAEKLLRVLGQHKPHTAQRILGLTSVDISTTKGKIKDWGILGLATIDGSACIISSFRTRRGAKNERQAAERFAKTAVHEIGHTLGLDHCPNQGCLMQDGKGTVYTTDSEYELCLRCRGLLTRRGVPLADGSSDIPWPKPS